MLDTLGATTQARGDAEVLRRDGDVALTVRTEAFDAGPGYLDSLDALRLTRIKASLDHALQTGTEATLGRAAARGQQLVQSAVECDAHDLERARIQRPDARERMDVTHGDTPHRPHG